MLYLIDIIYNYTMFCNVFISLFKASTAAFNFSLKDAIASSPVDKTLEFNSSTLAVKDVTAACKFSIWHNNTMSVPKTLLSSYLSLSVLISNPHW